MALTGQTIFLTGGAGFIGTGLIRRLIDHNRIVVYDNGHRDALQSSGLRDHEHLRFVRGDVLNYGHLREAILAEPPDYVVHLAAIAGVDTVLRVPVRTMKINILGTFHVLEAILGLGQPLKRFVDFSTSEVFGTHVYHAEEVSATTVGRVGEARWTYAVSKLAAEHLTHNYGKEFGLPAVSVRPFNVFGPGQVGVGAIHTFIVRALQGQPLQIHGDGNQIRAWCYIDDMVDGVLRTMETEAASGQVFNIGNPRNTVTIATLAEKVKAITQSQSEIVYVEKDYVDVELRIPSIDKAQTILDFRPQVDLTEGLRRTAAWYRDQLAQSGAAAAAVSI